MRLVLAEIEAASLLMYNREKVVLDITNPGPLGVNGKRRVTQPELKRVDRKHQGLVDAMVREVCSRLLGKSSRFATVTAIAEPSDKAEVLVWAEAARFLVRRIQDPASEAEECAGRAPDMSMLA